MGWEPPADLAALQRELAPPSTTSRARSAARPATAEVQTSTEPAAISRSAVHDSPPPATVTSSGSSPAAAPVPARPRRGARAPRRARGGAAYWRSLEELAETPEFEEMLHREFPRFAAEWPDGVSRRNFLQLAAASLGLAGLTACTRQPIEKIVPYVRQPEEIVPGRPLFFATAMPLAGRRDRPARREPQGPADQGRGQSRAPGEPRRDRRRHPGLGARPLRPRPLAGGARSSAGSPPGTSLAEQLDRGARRPVGRSAAPACAS